MQISTKISVLIVAALHIGFLVLEMFLWEHPIGREVFSMTAAQSAETAVLAANQGLYNGFLAAGLIWGLFTGKRDITAFMLICVIIAGIFGALTASPSILIIQALPGAIAITLLLRSRPKS
jgi:putative membrane protein